MKKIEEFYEDIKKEETAILATCSNNSVTMRMISPVYYNNKILFFTNKNSTKFNQLKSNSNCCISVGKFFAQAKATFCGSTMLDMNKELREIYSNKFQDAFEDNTSFGGVDSDFILLEPTKLSGWDIDENSQILTPFSLKL